MLVSTFHNFIAISYSTTEIYLKNLISPLQWWSISDSEDFQSAVPVSPHVPIPLSPGWFNPLGLKVSNNPWSLVGPVLNPAEYVISLDSNKNLLAPIVFASQAKSKFDFQIDESPLADFNKVWSPCTWYDVVNDVLN